MFCSKCGKEIDDSAVVCVGCGCPTDNYNKSVNQQSSTSTQDAGGSGVKRTTFGNASMPQMQYSNTAYSEDDKIIIPKIRQYISEVDSIFVISVISLILSFGIGIIFVFVGFAKIKKLPAIDRSIEDPNLIADFQKAQRKLSTSTTLLSITMVLFALAILFGFFIGLTMWFIYKTILVIKKFDFQYKNKSRKILSSFRSHYL